MHKGKISTNPAGSAGVGQGRDCNRVRSRPQPGCVSYHFFFFVCGRKKGREEKRERWKKKREYRALPSS